MKSSSENTFVLVVYLLVENEAPSTVCFPCRHHLWGFIILPFDFDGRELDINLMQACTLKPGPLSGGARVICIIQEIFSPKVHRMLMTMFGLCECRVIKAPTLLFMST